MILRWCKEVSWDRQVNRSACDCGDSVLVSLAADDDDDDDDAVSVCSSPNGVIITRLVSVAAQWSTNAWASSYDGFVTTNERKPPAAAPLLLTQQVVMVRNTCG